MSATRAEALAEGPFTLVLSAGFFGFYAHTGLLLALEQLGLRPARLVGVSAGALAGGLWAAGVPAPRLEDELRRLRRADFWDPGLPWGGLLRGEKLAARVAALAAEFGVARVEGCPLPFAAGVHDLVRGRLLLQDGPLDQAIRASCALPLLFRPVRLAGRVLLDGGVSDRAGLSWLGPGERALYHHLLAAGEAAPPAAPAGVERLAVGGLPALGPFALEEGPRALERVREAALRWLEQAPLAAAP